MGLKRREARPDVLDLCDMLFWDNHHVLARGSRGRMDLGMHPGCASLERTHAGLQLLDELTLRCDRLLK